MGRTVRRKRPAAARPTSNLVRGSLWRKCTTFINSSSVSLRRGTTADVALNDREPTDVTGAAKLTETGATRVATRQSSRVHGAISALLVTALAASTLGCGAAIEHPAATVAITAGVLAGGMCELATDGEHATCGIITLSAGLALGGIVLLALALGGDGNTVLHGPDEDERSVPLDPTLEQPGAGPAAPTAPTAPTSAAPNATPTLPPAPVN